MFTAQKRNSVIREPVSNLDVLFDIYACFRLMKATAAYDVYDNTK